MLPLGPEQDLQFVDYCPACLDEPHVDELGRPTACPEVVRAAGEGLGGG